MGTVSGPAIWLTIAGMALVTYALRVSFLLLPERATFPPLVRRALRYVPYAVLAALLMPALFGAEARALSPSADELVAGLIGGLIAWRTHSVILTLLLGMASLWTLQLVL